MEKVFKVVKKEEAGFDAEYWSSKSSRERLEAVETLRQQYQKDAATESKFQRVYRIIKR